MKARIINIGSAKGIRIPKAALKKSKLANQVQVEASEGRITIRSAKSPRAGWPQEFKRITANDNDDLLEIEPLVITEWDQTEWQW
jgi:antitoxin component of MazEF toxin-antitoxin module